MNLNQKNFSFSINSWFTNFMASLKEKFDEKFTIYLNYTPDTLRNLLEEKMFFKE